MDLKLENKVAIITGASRGIGKSIASKLLSYGCKVVLLSRKLEDLEKVKNNFKSDNIKCFECDITNQNQFKNVVREIVNTWGKLDILINNAGIGEFAKLEDVKVNHFESIFATNVFGLTMITQEVVKFFETQQYGMIINIGSSAATSGFPSGSVYCASKFALRGLTECWRHELRRDNIRVVLVNPSEVPTAFNNKQRVEREEQENKLSSKEISHAIVSAIIMDKRGFIPELNVWATNPF